MENEEQNFAHASLLGASKDGERRLTALKRATDRNARTTPQTQGGLGEDDVEHYETCECCQSFARMEKRYDHLRGFPQDDEYFMHTTRKMEHLTEEAAVEIMEYVYDQYVGHEISKLCNPDAMLRVYRALAKNTPSSAMGNNKAVEMIAELLGEITGFGRKQQAEIILDALAKNTPPLGGVVMGEDWKEGDPCPSDDCDGYFQYRKGTGLECDECSTLAKNTPPVTGGITQSDGASALGTVDSTCGEGLENSSQRCEGEAAIRKDVDSRSAVFDSPTMLEKVAEAIKAESQVGDDYDIPYLENPEECAQAAIAAMPYSEEQVRALVEAARRVVNGIGDDVEADDALEAALAPFKEVV